MTHHISKARMVSTAEIEHSNIHFRLDATNSAQVSFMTLPLDGKLSKPTTVALKEKTFYIHYYSLYFNNGCVVSLPDLMSL